MASSSEDNNIIQWVNPKQDFRFTERRTKDQIYLFRNGRQSTQSVTYDSNLSKYNNM